MPVLIHYGLEHDATEKLLLDSDAECGVCPKNCAPECPIEPIDGEEIPRRVTVTGDPEIL